MELLEYKHIKYNRTIRHLVSSIVQLVEQYPIEKITTSMIADVAEINRTTFYNYFKDKYDLINYVYYQIVKDYDNDFSRYDTFVKASINVNETLKPYAVFLKKTLADKSQNSLSDFITSYWVHFNKKLYKDFNNVDLVPPNVNLAIEMWVHGLVNEMSATSQIKYKNMTNTDYAIVQLDHAPNEIKKVLLANSIKAGIAAS